MENGEPIAGYGSKREMIEELYFKEGLSLKQLAARLDISAMTLAHWMEDLGIPRRSRGGNNMPGTHLWRIHRLDPRWVDAFPPSTIARWLGISYSLVYKFKRGVTSVWSLQSSPQQQGLNDTQR